MLQEKEAVLRRLAQAHKATLPDVARDALREADRISNLRKAILGFIKCVPDIYTAWAKT